MKIWHRKTDLLAAIVWTLLASFRFALFLAQPGWLQAGQVVFTLIMVALFVLRRPPSARGPQASFWLAVVASFLPALALRGADEGWPAAGLFVQQVGLVFMLVAIVTLNRSFGLAPANRGLVMHGVYRLVRHPLYVAEFVAQIGYCIGFASVRNWTIFVVFVVLQVLRIMAEERLLSTDANYLAYRQLVRWRLLPGVW